MCIPEYYWNKIKNYNNKYLYWKNNYLMIKMD